MNAADALSALADRLTEVLHHRVELGEGPAGDGPLLRILVHSLSPIPDVSKMTGRHLADQSTTLSWVFLLLLRGEAEGLLAALRVVEAAAEDLDSRPVLGGAGWRADLAIADAPDWATGQGAAIGLRMRVSVA